MSTDDFDLTLSSAFVTPGRRKNKLDATVAPVSTDDADSDYEVRSVWVDVTADAAYICVDSTVGAAVWLSMSGGDGGSLNIDLTVTGAHDIDRDDGETHDLTLTGNATFTLSGAFAGKSTDLRIVLRQDATGTRTVTWPGTITWVGGSAPTLQTAGSAVDTIGLLSVDDGVSWFGYHASASATVDADAVKALGRWEPVQFDDGSSPWPFVYFNDEIVVAWVATP